jgi:adenylate/nucleoside-diphosphate kinase
MEKEILNEWVFDCHGRTDLDYNLLVLVLFRIAHSWAVNIDYEEYAFLLTKLYERVTCKVIVKAAKRTPILPNIVVSFPEEEKKILGKKDEEPEGENDEDAGAEWVECDEDESPRSDYEYKYGDENDTMDLKRYKRPKHTGPSGLVAVTHLKDPFLYKETVEYDLSDLEMGSTVLDQIIKEEYVLPFGYPTEQYLFKLKNDVHEVVTQHREKNKNKDDELHNFNDPGDLKAENKVVEQTFFLFSNNGFHKEYRFIARILDSLYNSLRTVFRECVELSLRLFPEYPNINLRAGATIRISDDIPITEVSKAGTNPCLDRRIVWELFYLPKHKLNLWINQMYIVDHTDIQYAFKSKISKIENKRFLVLKEEEGVRREEDFIPAETDYKKMLLFMLTKKFESVYSNRVKNEEKEQARLKKQKEREEKKKKSGLPQKKAEEAHDAKADEHQKLLQNFRHLISKEGIIEDNVVNKNDLIIEANKPPMVILVIGKPRSGKSRVSNDLSESLDIVHVCVKTYINKLLAKVASYEPPEDLEEGQEPPKFLSELEEEVHQTLLVGKGPDDDLQVRMLADMVASAEAQTKGYVLDLPFHQRRETWFETINRGALNMKPEDISYVIELNMDDADIKLRAGGIRFDPETGEVVSRWERDERRKPKKKKRTDEEGEGEGEEEEEEEADPDDPDAPKKPKVLDEEKVLIRIKDLNEKLDEELQNYNSVEAPALKKLIEPLYHNQYIKFDCAGVRPEVIKESLVVRIKGEKKLLRPIAVPLESESDNKSYLTAGKEEGELPRRWSLWKQTDPVALFNGRVVEGQTEFAASFNDRVFLFENEENRNAFCAQPKLYLQKAPEMPDRFRLLLSGPTGAGKSTVAHKLSEKYGWRIVDWNQIVNNKIDEMRRRGDQHFPNNPAAEGYGLGLSEEEWNTILEGKPYDAFNFLPWVYEYLGFATEKRRPPPEPENEGEGEDEEAKRLREEEQKRLEEERKKEEERKEKERKKKEKEKEKKKKKGEEEEEEAEGEEGEEEEPLEDIKLSEIDLKVEDEETLQKPFVGGFILIGFPQTLEHVEKLKAAGIGFDKVIYLTDTDEENAGALLKSRMKHDEFYDPQKELENGERQLGILKEQYEEIVNEISCNGSLEEVMARVYAAIDPYFPQVDNPDNVRTTGDLGEEDKQLPRGEYGDFCPVTLTNDSWLFPGSEEFEAQVFERVYRLAGEPELEIFKADPMKFIKEGVQHPPQPHIMIIGPRGSGVSTQIEMICEKYKVPQFCLKQEFLKRLKEEKEERKKQRLLARGFKPPEPVEDGEEGPPPDPEIEDDPEDFDKEAHEKEVFRSILNAHSVLIIDGDWFDLPEDSVAMGYTDLLFDSRRPPELVIHLSVSEEKMLERLLDRNTIEGEYQELVDKRNEEKRQKREEDREAKLVELREDEEKTPEQIDEEIEEWDRQRDEEEKDEDDPDAPNLETMLEEQKEKLVESRNTQSDFLEEFLEKVGERKVPLVKVNGDLEIDRVHLRILSDLKPYMEDRNSMFERAQVIDLKAEEVKFYENSYLHSLSKYGNRSLFDISVPDMNKNNPLLYRDQLYFFYNEDEKAEFLRRPDVYSKSASVPKDVWLKPVCFVLGTPSSGKTSA